MNNETKPRNSPLNGARPTRAELLAAQERALRATKKMTAREGFESLVTAGIITPSGKLTRRYGGSGKNQRWAPYSARVGRK